eukprot:TRINITY_DN9268_c0_g1_i1.p3 TRINITY_DN9268_c0_g1~~TRINITY_DN9268_c0_g1_i1.p3  ORF type:complete len:100 (-),score=7.88 TRINITY_DN9268_c0_g1_i1:104-403(-)
MVVHACTHSVCLSSCCVPPWFHKLRLADWYVPSSSASLLRSGVYMSAARCPACRPEAFCLKGVESSRWCNNMFKRGKCANGEKCDFCHLHGKGGRCRVD